MSTISTYGRMIVAALAVLLAIGSGEGQAQQRGQQQAAKPSQAVERITEWARGVKELQLRDENGLLVRKVPLTTVTLPVPILRESPRNSELVEIPIGPKETAWLSRMQIKTDRVLQQNFCAGAPSLAARPESGNRGYGKLCQ